MGKLDRFLLVAATTLVVSSPVLAWACSGPLYYELLWPLAGEELPAGSGILIRGTTPFSSTLELRDSTGSAIATTTTRLGTASSTNGLFFVVADEPVQPGEALVVSVNAQASSEDPVVEYTFDIVAGEMGLAAGDAAAVGWETYFADAPLGEPAACRRAAAVSTSAHATGPAAAAPRLLVARSDDDAIAELVPAGTAVDSYLALLRVASISEDVVLEVMALDGQLLATETRTSPDHCFETDPISPPGPVEDGDFWYYNADLVDSVALPCGSGPVDGEDVGVAEDAGAGTDAGSGSDASTESDATVAEPSEPSDAPGCAAAPGDAPPGGIPALVVLVFGFGSRLRRSRRPSLAAC